MRIWKGAFAVVIAALGGCADDPTQPRSPSIGEPENLIGRYEWVLDGWFGTQPSGQPTVQLLWDAPIGWRGEPFRVYSRVSTDRDYVVVATVTACADGLCRFTDAGVAPGRRYDYYVAIVDERTGTEHTTPTAIQVQVPDAGRPSRPAAPGITALDEMLYLDWSAAGPADRVWKYLVFLERRAADSVFYEIGSTDGFGFVDVLAENGVAYRYSIAAVDTLGHISDRSPLSAAGIPRPEAQGALVYAYSDFAPESGYLFDIAGQSGRAVDGDSPSAHLRLEATEQGWFLRPLSTVAILPGIPSTALSCGPGSSPDCRAVVEAPLSGYVTTAVSLNVGDTYVLRLGSGSSAHFAKLRVLLVATAMENRRMMVFDWAVQMVPGARSLQLGG